MRNILVLFCLLLSTLAYGETEPQDLYQIELILFENVSMDAQSLPYHPVHTHRATTEITDEQLLTNDLLHLNPDEAHIANTKDLRVLTHLSWQQPVKRTKTSAHIFKSHENDWQVDATIVINKKNFIDLSADLIITEDLKSKEPQSFRLTQTRRLQVGELNYLDDPKFGLLVLVDKVTDPA